MAETLTGQDDDFALTQLYALLGKEKFQVLYPSYFPEQSPIILDTMRIEPILPLQDQEPMLPFFGPGKDSSLGYQGPQPFPTEKGIGSNNWAVAPSKTANKKAILCNDPHLKLNLPSIWFEVQLVTPSFNAYGASLPGAPGIISGFNEHVAWGVTNVSHDVRDWYQIQWKDASKKEYLFDGSYRKADHRYDTIRIRGQAPFVDTIIFTHWGPIAHSEKGNDYALRWSAHDPSNEALTFVLLNQAKNYQDYQKAISHFACPAQNIVFAAKDGDIALWTQGKLPLRRPQQGKFVQDGSKSSNAWQGFIPQEHIPHEHNPKKGFVGSANQHSINPQLYPYPYYGYFEEYRGRYLNQKLASMSNISIEDMKKLQNDDYSYKGKDFLPLLMKYLQRAQLEKDHLEILALVDKWDYLYDKNAQAPTIFEHWYNELEMALYDELMQPNDTGGLVPLRPFPYEWTTLNLLKRDTLNPIWDVKVTPDTLENIRHIVTLAFKNACKTLLDNPQKAVKKWGEEKASSVQHLAQINPFSFFYLDNGGHGSALNAMTSRNGPSWRMIVELGEVPKGLGVYPGGQSGNPGSPFYSNLLAAWTAGEYFDLLFWKKPEEAKDQALFHQYIKK
jgi:penicillin amidase